MHIIIFQVQMFGYNITVFTIRVGVKQHAMHKR